MRTVKEIAESLGADENVMRGVVKYLVDAKVLREAGSRPAAGGKGKPSTLYTPGDGSWEEAVRKVVEASKA